MIIHPESRIFTVLIALGWIGFLFYLAGLPRLPYVPVVPMRAVSPLAHYGTFAVVASLVYLVVAPRPSYLAGRVRAVTIAVALSIALALALEGVQYLLPLRSPELNDLLYNAAGAGTGAIAMVALDQLTVGRQTLSLMTAGVVLVLVAVASTSIAIWNPSHPWVGDHWHARYQISICGTILPPLAGTQGGIAQANIAGDTQGKGDKLDFNSEQLDNASTGGGAVMGAK